MIDTTAVAAGHAKLPFYKHLYFQVMVAIVAGIAGRPFLSGLRRRA
jgi:aerobic C4-dicarboxylate transport protein